MTTSITTPTAEQESPRTGVTIGVAVVCFAVGLAAVITSTGSAPHSEPRAAVVRTSSARPRPMPTGASTPAQTAATIHKSTAAIAPVPAAAVVHAETSTAVRTPVPTIARTETTATALAPEASMTLIPGRVAYLRCDGLTGERGRSPCPRDAALEHHVWEILGTLASCKPKFGRGTADVRLDFSRNQRPEVRVIPIAGSPEPSLDTQHVYACVGRSLMNVTTSLDPLYMMVSFRIALR